MKTLSKEITSTFFKEGYGFEDLKKIWVENYSNTTSKMNLVYSILRGKNYLKSFTPVRNANKIENGQRPYEGLRDAMAILSLPTGKRKYIQDPHAVHYRLESVDECKDREEAELKTRLGMFYPILVPEAVHVLRRYVIIPNNYSVEPEELYRS